MSRTIKTYSIKKRMSLWAAVVLIILSIPYMTNAPWTGSDYVFAGSVLSGCAIMYEFLTRNMKNKQQKIAVALAILLFIGLMIAWAATGPASEALHSSQ